MIVHREINLDEQKYVGIKTTIQFSEHDQVDFIGLHREVLSSAIAHVDSEAHFIALDSDFTKCAFSYTPLVPVLSFSDNDAFTHYTREAGDYYAFAVAQKSCGPAWFKELWKYINQNKLSVSPAGYDIEFYKQDYPKRINNASFQFSEEVFEILIRKHCK